MPVSHTLRSPYAQGTLFLEIPGVVRGEAIREAPVPVPGRPVHDGLQVLPLWPTCVRAGVPIGKSSFLLKKNLPYISVEYQYSHCHQINLLCMRGLLEGGVSRITICCEPPSYKYYLIMKCAPKILKIGLQINI